MLIIEFNLNNNMIDPEFFEQLKRFSFLVKKRVSSVYAGGRKSKVHGQGIETIDYREYFPGDDIKAIDWKIYGRTERLHIRRFEEEKTLTTHILIDSSKSMDFSTSGIMKKFDYGAMIAAGFMYMVVKENEKFGMATYTTELGNIIQPKKGMNHFFNAVSLLNNIKLRGKTNLGICAEQYAKTIKTKPLIVVISDFLEDFESIREGIYRISKSSNDVIVIHVADPGELNLWVEGDLKLHDLETMAQKRLYISPGFKERYKKRHENHIFKIRECCDDVRAQFYSVRTDRKIFETFLDIISV